MIIPTNEWYLYQPFIKKSKLKSKILIILFLILHLTSWSQTFQLKINGKNDLETKTIDSIGYITKHNTLKQLVDEIIFTNKKLSESGYIENKLLENTKENDSSYIATISLESIIKNIHIYIGIKKDKYPSFLFNTNHDSITLPYSQIKPFLKQTTKNLEHNGFAFAKVKFANIQKKGHEIYADLDIKTENKRILNAIEIKYQDQQKKIFPKGAEKQINKKYKNTVFNQKTIEQLYQDFEKFDFIHQIKYPEILFTKDTTKVFVYLEKRKANLFDGYLGFNNNESKKITLNGYLNLNLVNAIQNGETISIYWKNDGNNQKFFNANLTIPYVFKSPIGIKGEINIFKQDSIFQNTKTALQLGYSLDYNKRIYFGYESTESSDIQNSNSQNLNDFKNAFFNSTIEYKKNNPRKNLFPLKTKLNITLGTGKRSSTADSSIKQNFANFNIMNDFYINEKNIINVKNQNYYLKSNTYLTNELFRFGGINSVRGFSENSLQANLITAFMTEYRYLVTPNLYFNSILDYCYYQDPTTLIVENKNKKILGIGLGFGAQSANGIIRFAITNGKAKNEEIKFYNTNIIISYNVKF